MALMTLGCLCMVARLGPAGDAAMRGRRSTWRHQRRFCVSWHSATSTIVLRGRHGVRDIDDPFASQVWHSATSTLALRGPRGTRQHRGTYATGLAHFMSGLRLSSEQRPTINEVLCRHASKRIHGTLGVHRNQNSVGVLKRDKMVENKSIFRQ